MAQGKKTSEQLEPLNLRIPKELKIRFKVWCVQHERDMTEVLVAHIRKVLGDPPPKETPKKGSPRPPKSK